MDSAELLAFMRQFHSRTYDVVTRCGGRVVKHIGDEIMFSSGDLAGGCEIALALIEASVTVVSVQRTTAESGHSLYGPQCQVGRGTGSGE